MKGKFPIFDDILTFIWCKMKICPYDTLSDTVKSFYKSADICKARDLLFQKIPDDSARRVKHRKTEDIIRSVYELMQALPTEDPPVFATTDLNNIPFVNLSNIDGAALVGQQQCMKQDLAVVRTEQEEMRKQLAWLRNTLEEKGSLVPNMPNGVSPQSDPGPEVVDMSTELGRPGQGTYASVASGPTAGADVIGRRAQAEVNRPSLRGRTHDNGRSRGRGRGRGRGGRPSETSSNRPRVAGNTVANGSTGQISEADADSNGPDNEGFITHTNRHKRKRNRSTVTGNKTGTVLSAVSTARKIRVFVSRLEPDASGLTLKQYVCDMIKGECDVQRLSTKFPSYSSFMVSCDIKHSDTILCAEEWPQGVLIKRFHGHGPSPVDDKATACEGSLKSSRDGGD